VRVLISGEPLDAIGRDLIGRIPGVELLPYDPDADELDAEQASAQILIPPFSGSHRPIRLLSQVRQPRLVQLLSAGVDEWADDVPADVLLASARGAHAGPVSEWVLGAILAVYKQWPALTRHQDRHVWAKRLPDVAQDTLRGKRVLILGAGAIGTAVAALLPPFGATPTLVARTARAGVHGVAELADLLPQHQVLVVTAPLTEDTEGLVGDAALTALPNGALLVNAGRGRIVDTDALVAELRTGRIRAALDVVDPEPLPAEHPLWTCPGVIISPHSARTVPGAEELCYTVAAQQIGARGRNGQD
jgi:phosphoglycerate dehydrogenase-like enzyme